MSEQYTADYIRTSVRQMVADIAEVPLADVTDTASFMDQLGMDSLRAMELMVAVDKKYRIKIPEDQFINIANVDQAVAAVQRQLAGS